MTQTAAMIPTIQAIDKVVTLQTRAFDILKGFLIAGLIPRF
jgi:hypothetical protein